MEEISETAEDAKKLSKDENLPDEKSSVTQLTSTSEVDPKANEDQVNKPEAETTPSEQKADDPDPSKDSSKPELDEKNLQYVGDVCYYTDPNTKQQYTWDKDKNEWVAYSAPNQPNPEDYEYDGSTYSYVDKTTKVRYKWDKENNRWEVVKDDKSSAEKGNEESAEKPNKDDIPFGSAEGCYGFEDDTHTYTDPKDNTVYIWDREKNAWFPKVDDDFLAQYQMSYGFVDPNQESKEAEKPKSPPPKDVKAEKRKAPQEPTWFDMDDENNTKVYVSNLPLDVTETEFVDLMQKCGLVMRDLDTQKMKIKLYTKPGSTQLKGDGLCTYIKKESVELALNLLDGYNFKDHRIKVERAKFTMKGDAYDPNLKPKKKNKKKDKEKMKKIQEKLFDWRPDKLRGMRPKNESVVILKNLFTPEMFDKDVKLILEFQQDIRDECQKCGAIRRITVHDRHPEGVAQINFKEVEAADACIQLMNGRWFGQRKITAEAWDGKTKYKIQETEEEIERRIKKWDKFLENEEDEETQGGKESSEEKKKSTSGEKLGKRSVVGEKDVAKKKKKKVEREDETEENDSDTDSKSSGWASTDEEDDRKEN
ncbi:HIV Tat-specific factor 1 homolog [Nilaparvata lugens]|uniref:HIV Tat-specific factor 1 homolog n=1 Tax=Nilaparvata lugens TaxID=108931 RepID=UPI00193DBACF|nr:HIV Tat-specific factor 1 homolog [Nilaparvata lugens]